MGLHLRTFGTQEFCYDKYHMEFLKHNITYHSFKDGIWNIATMIAMNIIG